jgi:hypothetical protein
MDSTITIYNSYVKNLNTVTGSFPFYNNTAQIQCGIANTSTSTFNVLTLDPPNEGQNTTLILTQSSTFTSADQDPILIPFDISITNPNYSGIVYYEILD